MTSIHVVCLNKIYLNSLCYSLSWHFYCHVHHQLVCRHLPFLAPPAEKQEWGFSNADLVIFVRPPSIKACFLKKGRITFHVNISGNND